MHIVAYINNSFLLLLGRIPLYDYTSICLSIHALMFGTLTMKAAIDIHVSFLCVWIDAFISLGKYLGVE